ncbi:MULTISPECIES: XdhC family protein [unclassified Streptomyces]|uniref:XdhC family protein n=1 Tax=unclassified Streptomyces TaxID=2593676 RepID=UPI00225C2560|nr:MULTISPECIES: XdhC/CoxI family protein [unclassified Streptomyces]MCX4524777.1 XdhC family protein [Streptomyces sp. NBC_01551]MCX4544712.1 XdhC family protein [Streptomyces sp. NBC_01565]
MLDIAGELRAWCAAQREFALATVVAVSGSAPRGPGASLAVDAGGTALGSLSGGCVESAVHEICLDAIASGESGVHRFGYSDDDAFAVGLTCGGVLDVLVTPVRGQDQVRPVLGAVLDAALGGAKAAFARVVTGPPQQLGRALAVHPDGSYEGCLGGSAELDRAAARQARALLLAGRTGTAELGTAGGLCGQPLTLLVESAAEPPRLIVYGAIDFASALARIGAFLGHRVTVCDARPVFTTPARFPDADEVIVDWPHRHLAAEWEAGRLDARTAVCVLTHDAKFDVPLLALALRLPLGYIGAMGSRRTHEERAARLRDEGVTADELARLRSPIGLDLGGGTPEETALSIAAEFTAARHGGSVLPLAALSGPVHRRVGATGAPFGTKVP